MADSSPKLSDPCATLEEFVSTVRSFSENPAFQNAENFMNSFKQLAAKVKAQEDTVMNIKSDYITTKQELDRSNERFLRAHREETRAVVDEANKLQAELDRAEAEIAQEKSHFHGLSKEMKDLRQKLNDEGKQSQKLQDQITSLKQGKAKLEGEVAKANDTLRDRNAEIKEQRVKIKEYEKSWSDLSNKYATLESKFREQSAVIKQIYIFAPISVKDDIVNLNQSLNQLWQRCFDAIYKCFDVDIDMAVLENEHAWTVLRDVEVVPSDLPFPPSNATPAKRIRSAAVMAVLAESLVQHIFTPTYIFFDDEEFRNMSFHLATAEADRGKFVRRVLNGTSLDKQAAVKAQRIGSVLQRVDFCVQPLLDEKVRSLFRTDLSQLLAEAAELWSNVQRMGSLFDTDVAIEAGVPWQWRAISWSQQNNGYTEREVSIEHLRDLDARLVLFPRVFIVTDSVDQPVFPGVVLPRSETRAAKEEWDKIRQTKPMLGRSSTSKSMRPRRMTLNQTSGAGQCFLG